MPSSTPKRKGTARHDAALRLALDELFPDSCNSEGGEEEVVPPPPTEGAPTRKRKRRRISRSDRAEMRPLLPLALPGRDAVTPAMAEHMEREMADFEASMAGISERGAAIRQTHPNGADVTDLKVSTITFSCPLRGPHVDGIQLGSYLHGPECEQRSLRLLGAAMMYEDQTRDANFNNATSVWLPDAKPNNIKSIKFFYPRPSLQITGPKTIRECFTTAEYARSMLAEVAGRPDGYVLDVRAGDGVINMINTDFVLGFGLRLEQVAFLFKGLAFGDKDVTVKYKCGRFSAKERNFGVHLELWHQGRRVSVKVFHTGSILINSTSPSAIKEAHGFVASTLLDNHRNVYAKIFGRSKATEEADTRPKHPDS